MFEFKTFLFYSSDQEFTQKISQWIDLENIIDWHLLLLFTNNSDGIMKNFYLYKMNSRVPFRIAIWDYDHSFGRDGDNEMNMIDQELDCNRSVLLERLSQIKAINYNKKLIKRWTELRESGIFSFQNIKKLINENNQIIHHAIKKNSEIWPIHSKWYYDDNNYDEELSLILTFIKLRLHQLDQQFLYKKESL